MIYAAVSDELILVIDRRRCRARQRRRWCEAQLGGGMSKLDVDVEIMRAAGLEDEEILRLAYLKWRVSAGGCTELTMEYKRLLFFKFLYETGRLSD